MAHIEEYIQSGMKRMQIKEVWDTAVVQAGPMCADWSKPHKTFTEAWQPIPSNIWQQDQWDAPPHPKGVGRVVTSADLLGPILGHARSGRVVMMTCSGMTTTAFFHLRIEIRVVQSLCGVSVNCFQLFSVCLRIRHRTDKFTICKHYTFQLFACICNRITYGCHSRDSTPLTLQSRVASHQPCHALSANTGQETIK